MLMLDSFRNNDCTYPKLRLMGQAQNGAHNLLIQVGLVFPTKGSSWPSDPTAPLIPYEFPLFPPYVALPLCVILSPGCPSSLSLSISSSELPTSPFSFYSPLYSFRWVDHDYSFSSLVWVGSNLIIPNENMLRSKRQ